MIKTVFIINFSGFLPAPFQEKDWFLRDFLHRGSNLRILYGFSIKNSDKISFYMIFSYYIDKLLVISNKFYQYLVQKSLFPLRIQEDYSRFYTKTLIKKSFIIIFSIETIKFPDLFFHFQKKNCRFAIKPLFH